MITLIAAVDKNKALGCSRNAPWSSVADLEFFFRETTGGLLIMDRDTYDRYPSSDFFYNRKVVVIDPENEVRRTKSTHSVVSLMDALKHAWWSQRSRVYIVGSAELYARALPMAHRILLSESNVVNLTPDDYFPEIDDDIWEVNTAWLLECTTVPTVKEYLKKPAAS